MNDLLGFEPDARLLIVNSDDFGMHLLDSFRLELDGKAATYARLLREVPVGLSEWAVHPGLGDEDARAIEPDGWRVRRTDYEFLTSPEAREILRSEGIVALDYRVLQEVWVKRGWPGTR
ncbi:ChbG/HpnK family deacetylase [Nonomuraea jabiensis]|uniref:ChbG/HpnK family deacetylase n=1 Tax=Nonomuraea jabiensis TaxID=882448 RepID=UPI00368AB729